MREDGHEDDGLERVRERGQVLRRSARWNVAHALEESGSSSGAQSIHRALILLNLVGVMARDRPGGVALADLARVSGRPKASVHRVLGALVQLGFVERVESTGRYRLGVQSQILGELAGARTDPIIRSSRASLIRIAELSEDTTFLTLRQGSFSICARREEGLGEIRNNALAVGDRHPLGVGAGGLAILAALDDAEVEETIEVNREVLTRHYPRIDAGTLRSLVARSRSQGYSLNEGLGAPGSWAIGVLLHIPNRPPTAALSIASIEQRLRGRRREELVTAMKKEVGVIQAALSTAEEDTEVSARSTDRRRSS